MTKVNWTEEQESVIDARGNNILVSAAAGSGKTAVLSERIVGKIIKDGVSIDSMLIMTFTNVAAKEMKEKIRKRMVETLKTDIPDEKKRFLEEQLSILPLANISTIHIFCNNVIRDNIYLTDLSPAFRIATDGETVLLKQEALDTIIEKSYMEKDLKFYHLMDSFNFHNTDKDVENLILDVYENLMAYENPKKQIENIIRDYEECTIAKFLTFDFGKNIIDSFQKLLEEAKQNNRKLFEILSADITNPAYEDVDFSKIKTMFENDKEVIYSCLALTNKFTKQIEEEKDEDAIKSFEELCRILRESKFASSRFTNKLPKEKTEEYKFYRNNYSTKTGKLKTFFSNNFDGLLDKKYNEHLKSGKDIEALLNLVREFMDEYRKLKIKKDLIDFTDMEHFAYEILSDEQSDVSKMYRDKFDEVLIDEYQDTSYIQEAILNLITRKKDKKNLFMVGDVKQSIYAFRNSKPKIFVDKYEKYDADPTKGRLINLNKNFRSRQEILNSVNDVFYASMKKDVGGIDYTNNVALKYKAIYYNEVKDQNFTTEMIYVPGKKSQNEIFESKSTETNYNDHILDKSEKEVEAIIIAQKIRDMKGKFIVTENELQRPATYKDFAILLMTKKNWSDEIQRVFNNYNIPYQIEKDHGYYDSIEIETMLNYLRIMDNPRQDIPLVSVLSSPIGGLSNDELASIAIFSEKKYSDAVYFDNVKNFIEKGQDVKLVNKLAKFFDRLEAHRKLLICKPLHEVMIKIIDDTGYEYYATSLPDGSRRKANLDILIEESINFETSIYQGLSNFIVYIDRIRKFEIDKGESNSCSNGDAVTIITTHKSKGLEYPIVFLPELGKGFTSDKAKFRFCEKYTQDETKCMMAMKFFDEKTNTIRETVGFSYINEKIKTEDKGERLRVLYVAMTRAKEKLIMIGTDRKDSSIDEKLKKWGNAIRDNDCFDKKYLESYSSYLDIVMPVVLSHSKDFVLEKFYPETIISNDIKSNIKAKLEVEKYRNALGYGLGKTKSKVINKLQKFESFVYPDSRYQLMKPKVSVSLAKSLSAGHEKAVKKDTENTGALVGTAYHNIMEHLDYNCVSKLSEVELQIDKFVEDGIVDVTIKDKIDSKKIFSFANSDFGMRVQRANSKSKLFREQGFMMSIKASDIYDSALENDEILMQGIIDLYLEEDDGIVLLDYKTDNVDDPFKLIDRYKVQLEYYKEAIDRWSTKKVKEVYIYSFKFDKLIKL